MQLKNITREATLNFLLSIFTNGILEHITREAPLHSKFVYLQMQSLNIKQGKQLLISY